MKKHFVIVFAALLFTAWIDPFKDAVENGNRSYEKNDQKKALEYYGEAEKHAPDDKRKAMLEFNKGDACFQQGNYDIAVEKFRNALSSENPDIQKKSLLNMGNAYLKQKKYKEAVESFSRALEIDPNYDKAKKNLEYLLKEHKNENRNGDNGKDKTGSSDSNKEQKDGEAKNSEKKMNDIQARNLLESMKNKPVRKQKGKGDGTKYLEKYW